ncbi:zeta toxin family protein [Parafilimonas sp.]|uniref:zeta toxin family protein n=1 Tax=Parafilimonas sp. TaxID=1969739 RepID=UPI0039E6EE38
MAAKRNKAKRIRIIAGPNGSGKTTLYYLLKDLLFTGVWINADEILSTINKTGILDFQQIGFIPDAKSFKKFVKLSSSKKFIDDFKIADEINKIQINTYTLTFPGKKISNECVALLTAFFRYWLIHNNHAFTTETVMSHASKIDLVKTARKKGYKTYLYFIATIDPQINKMRIATRVKKGGHFVPEKKLAARFTRSVDLLKNNLSLFDRIFVLDNSGASMRLIVSFAQGKLEKIYDNNIPLWIKSILDKEKL